MNKNLCNCVCEISKSFVTRVLIIYKIEFNNSIIDNKLFYDV